MGRLSSSSSSSSSQRKSRLPRDLRFQLISLNIKRIYIYIYTTDCRRGEINRLRKYSYIYTIFSVPPANREVVATISFVDYFSQLPIANRSRERETRFSFHPRSFAFQDLSRRNRLYSELYIYSV